jgi:hypothetical protein
VFSGICESTYVVLNCRGGRLGRDVEGMVSIATEAIERRNLVLRKEVLRVDEERAAFISGLSRGIEG